MAGDEGYRVRLWVSRRQAELVLGILGRIEKLAESPAKGPRRKLERIHTLMPRLAQLLLEPVAAGVGAQPDPETRGAPR